MAETLELQQVTCPSCKRVVTSFNPFQAEVECPYCHNKAFNPLITAKKVPVPERLIVFRTNENDFEQRLIDNLIESDYVPTDVFQTINPGNVIKAYLPMFLYEGRYQSSWNCQVAYETTELRASSDGTKVRNKTVKKFAPQSGTSQGNFSFLCLAYDGDDIPEELRAFSAKFPYNQLASKEYDPALLGLEEERSPMTLALDSDADVVWSKYGEGLVNALAEENAQQQLRGEEIKNFRCSSSYDLNHGGRYVLAPFWFVYYTYNNQTHYFIMDGLGENHSMTTPIDQAQVDYVKKCNLWNTLTKWAWLLGLIFLFTIGFKAALIFWVAWFITYIVVGKIMKSKIKTFMENAREQRRAGAQRI